MVLEHIESNPAHTPHSAATALVNAAFEAGSPDNISVAVGIFHYCGVDYRPRSGQ